MAEIRSLQAKTDEGGLVAPHERPLWLRPRYDRPAGIHDAARRAGGAGR
jgi:hypothetical protein